MSFYPQPFKYQCGPFALKYALVMLGKFVNEREIGKRAGSTWWYGTDEIGLQQAAKTYKCKMKYFRREKPGDGIKVLTKHLKAGYPCILSVDQWEHWICVVNVSRGKFVVVDSGLDKVIVISSAQQLSRRWRYDDDETGDISYDGYAVIPKFKVVTKAKFTLEKAKYVMREKHKNLAKNWDTYFNDLISICRPRTPQSVNILSFSEFLRRHQKLLVENVADWHGTPTYTELEKVLADLKFVAEVYDLIIHVDDEKKALVDLSSILMMYSCGKYGMDKIY